MKHNRLTALAIRLLFIGAVLGITCPASAQSDPSNFTTVINLPPDPNISSWQTIDSDTQVNLSDGGTIGHAFKAGYHNQSNANIEVNISGGTTADYFEANSGSEINISGGTVGKHFDANSGSVVNISGGNVGALFDAGSGSVVNITGGIMGNGFYAISKTVVNISGGEMGDYFSVNPDSVINISGGTMGDSFVANFESEVNLFGSSFFLDDMILSNLPPGQPLTISDRDVMLEGILVDGSAFSFDLFSSDDIDEDYFSSAATLTITLVPPFAGDFNYDGIVDAADYTVWRDSEGQSGGGLVADGNGDGTVGQSDYALWVASFGNTSTLEFLAVPEPKSLLLAFFGAAAIGLYQTSCKQLA